ncbi:hypothetical protein [Pelagivirga sediminicola]|uniref:hypothetical protein n=1 Tax=Pelagivirga sediminicola TaxID=2170575 RepID=UPI0010575540
MDHVRGAPFHPQIRGKIECCHQTMKNRVLLKNYYLPGDFEHRMTSLSSQKPVRICPAAAGAVQRHF